MTKIRNIAIVAHVDHGKTTLVDEILKQTGAYGDHQRLQERVMDSNPIERERGITIFSKNASVVHKDTKINIVDTPGHADFGAEVERILDMVDGVLLLVDAAEGVMPQTRFVLQKSLAQGLMPVVVINKVDRPDQRVAEVEEEIADLFLALEANDDQLDFPTVYCSAKNGVAAPTLDEALERISKGDTGGIPCILDQVLEVVPAPRDSTDGLPQFLVTSLDYSDYLGRIGVGRVRRGTLKIGQNLVRLKTEGGQVNGRITKMFVFSGLGQAEATEVKAGDIASVAGFPEINIGETITDANDLTKLPSIAVDEPTISISMMVNNGPFAGLDGKFVTSRHLKERLEKELRTNVALRLEDIGSRDEFRLLGRGELHLSILFETMRREGFEFCLSRPRVLFHGEGAEKEEPYEDLFTEMEEDYQGSVIEALGRRKGELRDLRPTGDGRVRMTFSIPTRGLLGYRGDYLTMTRGTGVMYHNSAGYGPFKGDIPGRKRGVLISKEPGTITAFALFNLQERGDMILGPGVKTYGGMIVGLHARENDLVVQSCRKKQLTNMRTTATDDALVLTPHLTLGLEQMMEFIQEDELVEVTPNHLRLRKRTLDPHQRKREGGVG